MCELCDKIKLSKSEQELTEWLVNHDAWEVFDSKEEADIMLKAYIDEHVPFVGFDESYEESWVKVSQSFRRQQKAFPAKAIIQNLFNFRPITKANQSDIEKYVEDQINQAGFLNASSQEGKAIIQRLTQVIFGISLAGYTIGGNEALKKIKHFFSRHLNPNIQDIGASIESSFNLTNKDVLNYLDNYAASRVTQINDVTRRMLKDTIVSGYNSAKGPGEIAQQITKLFNEFSSTRAKVIAFTELSIAAGQARLESYTRRNVPYKEWITRGPRPCPICVGNKAQGRIPMTAEFVGGQTTVPAHPLCMCDIVPRLSEFWCGGTDMAKAVFQGEDKCPGYTWYGGTGNEKTSPTALPTLNSEWGKKPRSVMRWKPVGTKAEADAFSKKSKIASTLYHGTPNTANYTKMKENGFAPSLSGKFGPGMYLTSNKSFAETYAGKDGVVAKTKVSILGKIFQANTANGKVTLDKLKTLAEGDIMERALRDSDFRKRLNNDPMLFERWKFKNYYNRLESQGYSAIAYGSKDAPGARYQVEELVVFDKKHIMIYE